MSSQIVLVTGGSGFIGGHVIICALKKGYRVRTTVRSLKKSEVVREKLRADGISEAKINESLEFVEVDLLEDKGWDEACKGCDYVLHVASPYPLEVPKDENEIIKPAVEGTKRALEAAKKAGTVKRIVVTSSFASVGYGHEKRSLDNPFTEKDWTILDHPKSPVGPYMKSKTMAEHLAWDWIKTNGGEMELVTVNPVVVFGPALDNQFNTGLELLTRMLNGDIPGLPNLNLSIVDVRDVADLHLLAMEKPEAAGQRYLAVSDEQFVSTKDIANYLKEGLPSDQTKKMPKRVLPNWLLHVVSYFDKSVSLIVPELGVVRPVSNEKARKELNWTPRSARDAVVSSGKSLIEFGLVKV